MKPQHKMLTTVMIALVLSVASITNLAGRRSIAPFEPLSANEDLRAPKGLPDSDWSSIRKEHLRHRQAAFAVDGGWQARNYQQNWLTQFDGRGFEVTPADDSWRWGLELATYGYRGQERRVSAPKSAADVEKFSYQWDSILREWYINGEGLEHGYTLAARPGEGDGLSFHLKVRGTLEAQFAADGKSVAFLEQPGGRRVVNYSGLKVTDAGGRQLAARFADEVHGLRLEIDDSNARYPITVDPIAQEAYVKASNTDAGDWFGYSVAVWSDPAAGHGPVVVVGAPHEDSNGIFNSGAAYIFTNDLEYPYPNCNPQPIVCGGHGWRQEAYLKAPNPVTNDLFGKSVAVSEGTVVIGAPGRSVAGVSGAGAAYVFLGFPFSFDIWNQAAVLSASSPTTNAGFGGAVAVSGVSATGFTAVAGATNAAYVFTSSSGTFWSSPTSLPGFGNFGFSVAVDEGTVVVGAPQDAGRVLVYTQTSPGVWSQQAALTASNGVHGDDLGWSVAISGDTIIAGAPFAQFFREGAAYVFKRTITNGVATWSEQNILKPSAHQQEERFGYAVAVSRDTAVVGAYQETDTSQPIGKAYSGAAYVFQRGGTTWNPAVLGWLKASNPDTNDFFGFAVAISGDIGVVGGYGESSNATGFSGNQADNSSPAAGAAYVFKIPFPTVGVGISSVPQLLTFTTDGFGCAPGTHTTPISLEWVPNSSCTVTFAATQPNGLKFTHWDNDATNTNPVRTVTAPRDTFTSYFAHYDWVLKFSVSPASIASVGVGMIVEDAAQPRISCPFSCNRFFLTNESPVFNVKPPSAFPAVKFAGWSGDDCTTAGLGPCAPTIDKDKNIIANFVINAAPTPMGNQTVQPTNSAGVPQPITVTFPNVTAPGGTTATPTQSPAPPANFSVNGTIYNITTTAQFTTPPSLTVCFLGTFNQGDVMQHYENGGWVTLPNQQLLPAGGGPYTKICADTNSLSPFGVFTPLNSTNHAPTANAGANQTLEAIGPSGATVSLSGTGSDPDGDPLTFSWSGPCGAAAGANVSVTCPLGVNTMSLTISDGHSGSANSSVQITVRDTTPPSVVCAAQDTAWHPMDVAIACSSSDLVGLANPADASFVLSTSVPPGIETALATTSSRTICDGSGNCAAAGPIGPIKVDKKSPAVAISTPANNASYILNQQVAASFVCTDDGSGVANCNGSVANGANIDTSSVGTKSLTVTSADAVGNNSVATVGSRVVFAGSGLCNGDTGHAILRPIAPDGSSVFKQGATVPAKFRVCDATGNSIGTPGVVSSFSLIQVTAGTTSQSPNADVPSTTPDTEFGWDPNERQWIFNISTKTFTAGNSYYFLISLSDGTEIRFSFGLR